MAAMEATGILDSGASRHLVNDEKLLNDSTACSREIAMADGKTLHPTRVGSERLEVIARGMDSIVTLMDVYFCRRDWRKTSSRTASWKVRDLLLLTIGRGARLIGAATVPLRTTL